MFILIHLIQWKSILVNHELCTVSQNPSVLRFYLCTLYKYSLIDSYELITFPCINLRFLFMYYIHKLLLLLLLLLYAFYCQDSFCTVPVVI